MESSHHPLSRLSISRRRPTPYYSETMRRRNMNMLLNLILVLFIFVAFFSFFHKNQTAMHYPFSYLIQHLRNVSPLLHSENQIPGKLKMQPKSHTAHTVDKYSSENNSQISDVESMSFESKNEEIESDEELLKVINFNDRYLYYPRCGDWCKGISHHRWSMLCMLGEAIYLNRTLIFDYDFCIWEGHNAGQLRVRPISMYYNLGAIQNSIKITPRRRFTKAWKLYDSLNRFPKITQRKVDKFFPSPQLLKEKAMIITRDLGDSLSKDYAFQVCEVPENSVIKKPFAAIWGFSPHLMAVLWKICDRLQWDYDAVHVRRGDKILDPKRWPNLDRDTRPEHILEKLLTKIPVSRRIYIATDERSPNFFRPLRRVYDVYTLDDFKYLWAKNSQWYNESLKVMNLKPDSELQPEFDAYMQGMIDYRLIEYAKLKIETFNDLTSDPRHGVIGENI